MIDHRAIIAIVADVEQRTRVGKDYPPLARAAVLEVCAKRADSLEHIQAAAAYLIDTAVHTPLASEWLKALAATAAPRPEGEVSKALGCERCDWTGWITTQREGHSWATECVCRRQGTMRLRPEVGTPSAAQIAAQRKLLAEITKEVKG